MPGWSLETGRAIALPQENIDTDQLIPARFMSTPRAQGYGDFLLHDLRNDKTGKPNPDFALNHPKAKGASILIARRNFGAGSSREAAVYALVDAGFRVIIAPSFGDIFSANAVNNGLLPAKLDPDRVETLIGCAPCEITVDLNSSRIIAPTGSFTFDLESTWREKLINGWDDVDLTFAQAKAIHAFGQTRKADRAWTWPA